MTLDVPHIDPDKLTLSKRGEGLFKSFLRAIELSATRPQQLKGLFTILTYLIPIQPHIVILLSKTTHAHFSPTVHKSLLTLQLLKPTKASNTKKQSFLHYILQLCMDTHPQSLLSTLINSLIEPQIQNQLILYKGEIIPTREYHRHLVTNWLLASLEDASKLNSKFVTAAMITSFVNIIIVLFRDSQLLSTGEVELYYQACSKCCDLLRSCVNLNETQKLKRMAAILSCFKPLKPIRFFQLVSEHLDQSCVELLYNSSGEVINHIIEICFHKQTLTTQPALKSEKKQYFTDKAVLNTESKLVSIGKNTNLGKSDYLTSAHNVSKIVFGIKPLRSHSLILIDPQQLNLPLFEKEASAILSKLPNNAINTASIK